MTSDRGMGKDGVQPKPADDPYAKPDEAGAYIGSEPEREAETIPGGVDPKDERIAAHSTQVEPIDDESETTSDDHGGLSGQNESDGQGPG